MLADGFREFRQHLAERLYSPLLGSFLISWSVWNYKFFLIIFSKEPVEESFALIAQHVFSSPSDYWLNGFLYPLLTTCVYIFAYPYPAKWVFSFSRSRQREILEVQRKIENETPLTLEESVFIRARIQTIRKEFSEQIREKDSEIETLKAQLGALRSSVPVVDAAGLGAPDSPSVVQNSVLEDLAAELLEMLEKGGARSESSILSIYDEEDKTRVRFVLTQLRESNLIEPKFNQSGDLLGLQVTHLGRKRILRNRGELPDG